jgi:hemoglobin
MRTKPSTVALTLAALSIVASCATGATPNDPSSPAASKTGSLNQAAAPTAALVPPGARPAPKSLYDRLGGKGAIGAVIDDFLVQLSKDTRINGRFAHADIPHLRAMLIDQICEAAGGPCVYRGRDMVTSHAGMKIVDAEFDDLVQDLEASLDHLKVPAGEQNDLISALAPMRSAIVQGGAGDGRRIGVAAATPAAPTASPTNAMGNPVAAIDPVVERAQAVREAASLLEKANTARLRGSRSFADQLFSSAELIVGTEAVADLAPLFRDGAPPRVTSPLKTLPLNASAQPAVVGNSDAEDPDSKPKRGSLTGSVQLPGGRPPQSLVVVTLEPVSGKFARRAPKRRTIEQRNREFAPKILVVPVGSTVSFPNFDTVYHNVFSRSETHPFDLGLYKGGQARELVFDREGVVRVGCNLHANMSAYVVTVAAPHYIVTDTVGHFAFRSLNPGRYRLRAWIENSDAPVIQTVEIKPAHNSVVVPISSEGPSGPQADKFGVPRGGAIRH